MSRSIVGGALVLLLASWTRAEAARPNLLVLYSDDAGFADFGFQPNVAEDMKALTPHIDRIAREGARFSQAYMSASVCSPSRAGLMTGRHQQRFGYDNNLPPGFPSGLDLSETFVSKRLQGLDYATGLVGKWHLGYPAAYHPNRRGWDWFYGLLQGSRPYHAMPKLNPNRGIQENGRLTPEGGYTTDRFGEAAVRFIHTPREAPFFLFVSFTAPHGPLQPEASDLEKLAHLPPGKRRKYAGLVVGLDRAVGKILEALDATGQTENTLVIFTNDNGGQTLTGANNAPLRGRKGSLYEGGIRVPCAMRWPGHILPGSVIDDPVVAIDFAPSFVRLAGGELEAKANFDGTDLGPLLRGEHLPERTLFWRQHGTKGARAVRRGRWKLLRPARKDGARLELYDLSEDVSETKNLAAEQPDIVRELSRALETWNAELEVPRWGPGAPGHKKPEARQKPRRRKERRS